MPDRVGDRGVKAGVKLAPGRQATGFAGGLENQYILPSTSQVRRTYQAIMAGANDD